MLQRSIACRFAANPLPFGRLNHIAIAVPKSTPILQAAEIYKSILGATVSAPQDLPEHGVTTVFIELPNTKLELLHPLGEDSPIQGFLEKQPSGGMHHLCVEVEDIHESIKKCKELKLRTLSAEPKIGAHGKPVIFLHPKDCGGVLVELEQV